MFGPFERAVAGRYLRARRGERFVSIIAVFSMVGIAIGVGALIIVMSVMNGFRDELLGRILGLNGELAIYAAGPPLHDFDQIVAKVRGLKDVTSVYPMVQAQALLTSDQGDASGGLVRGVRPEDLKHVHVVADGVRDGSLDDFKGPDAAAIGVELARRLRIGVGGTFTLVSPQAQATVMGGVPRMKTYTVVATFSTGYFEADQSYVYLPLEAAQVFFKMYNGVTQIEVGVRDADHVDLVNREIQVAMRDEPQAMRIADWTTADSSLFNAVKIERSVMFLILSLIVVVAAFNVVSSLIMMVKDKTRDIAVLRTIGASSGSILRIFVMCGAFVGVTGTLAGAAIGIAFCLNIERIRHLLERVTGANLFNPAIYFLEQLPAKLEWREVAQVIGMALILSLLATVYPSWRAARTDPIQGLRNG